MLIALVTFSDYVFEDARHHNLSDVVFVATLLVPPYVFGRLVRRLAAQKALVEEREELVTREAVRAERDRIARDLHDVIAHSVSAMVVQTAAAQDLVRSDPTRAERSCATWPTPGGRHWSRRAGCCTSSATTPTAGSRRPGSMRCRWTPSIIARPRHRGTSEDDMSGTVEGVFHPAINVSDMAEAVRYYRDLLA